MHPRNARTGESVALLNQFGTSTGKTIYVQLSLLAINKKG
jgi:hypothetical protein